MIIIYFIIVPVILGVIAYLIPKIPLRLFVVICESILFAFFIFVFLNIMNNGNIKEVLGAQNSILGITLIADRYTISLIGLSIFLFSISFIYTMHEEFFDNKFVMLFLILQGLLCGVFLTDDLFNIYVFLEVATVVVAILIMYKKDIRSMYDGMVYLLSQVVCMLFYLFGIGYLYKIFGVLSISEIAKLMPMANPDAVATPFAFIMTAICLKSAFFPLFSWLPHAHGTPSAPSAVSAILSGLYVKNGIYLFFVFINLFSPAIDYAEFFIIIGGCTAVLGFVMALSQTDIKLILAFHTISQIGLISLGLTAQNEISTYGALYHIICHALFKSLLFLSAGMIIKQYKTRDIRKIHGVLRTMPLTGIATVLGVLGISGAPFFNSSISKYFMQYGAKGTITETLIIIVNFGTILSFVKYSHMLLGEPSPQIKQSRRKKLVLLCLGVSCIVGGIFGVTAINTIFNTDVSINSGIYIEKTIVYLISVIVAFLLYKFILKKNKYLYSLRKFSLNFQQIVMAILVFYISISLYLSV